MMDQIDKTFCQNYLDYLLTEYRPKGKRVSNFTLHTYYRILNGALNAAVRADIIKSNPFTKINNSDKIRLPESKRSYMTIEEVRALIATPMKNEAVKQAYLFCKYPLIPTLWMIFEDSTFAFRSGDKHRSRRIYGK